MISIEKIASIEKRLPPCAINSLFMARLSVHSRCINDDLPQ